jgi:hypothetical protein
MSKGSAPTCADCYFRRAGLCALPGDDPCPTFRQARGHGPTAPRQPQLVPRSLALKPS